MAAIIASGRGLVTRRCHSVDCTHAQSHEPLHNAGRVLRMSRRVLFAVVGIVIVSAVLSTLLLANVNADRGRDEIDYLTMHPVSLETNAALTQPVPLQRVDPYAIALPYKWVGLHPARIEARITGSDGSVLSDTTLSAAKSRAPVWLQPIGDGSVWQREAAAFLSIRVPSRATGTITLTVTRVDTEP